MKTFKTLVLILTTILFFTGCKKDETFSLWNISGEVRLKDAEVESITSPMEGVKVYLFSFPFTMDTTTSWFSRESILDSALTNNEGLYNFKLVAPGDYFVYPSDTTESYDFENSENSDSYLIAQKNAKSDYEINFSALQKIPANATFSTYGLGIFSMDYYDSNSDHDIKTIAVYQKTRTWEAYWDGFIPKVHWGDWYYSLVGFDRSKRLLWEGNQDDFWSNTEDIWIYTLQHKDNLFYQYEGDFEIRFYLHDSPWDLISTLSAEDVLTVSKDDFFEGRFGDVFVNADVYWLMEGVRSSVTKFVPDAPSIGTATAGNAQATVSFSAPYFSGGSQITSYTATSSPVGGTGSTFFLGESGPITVTGLTNGTAYTFTVTATNANGTSLASSASNSVIPVAPTAIGDR